MTSRRRWCSRKRAACDSPSSGRRAERQPPSRAPTARGESGASSRTRAAACSASSNIRRTPSALPRCSRKRTSHRWAHKRRRRTNVGTRGCTKPARWITRSFYPARSTRYWTKAKCCCARETCWSSRAPTTPGATAATGPRALLSCSLMRKADLTLIALVLALGPLPAGAQDYPSKPIRYIVATAPGGLMDLAARLLADYMEKRYGHRLVVENRGGGGGVLAGDAVAKAAPDGYTLAQIQVGNVAINPFTVKDMPFDPLRDFAAVSTLTSSPVVVTVDARLGVSTLQEFIALARREPGKLNYGSAGPGTIPHLSGELFCQAAGVRLTPVHYRGAGPALADLPAGHDQAGFVGLGVVRTQMAGGTVKVLAVSQPRRLQAAPEVPTHEEAGLPAFEVNTWFGVVPPRGTPQPLIALLNREIHAALDDATVRERLQEGGLEPLKETPAQFTERMKRDHERYRDIVKAAGLKPE